MDEPTNIHGGKVFAFARSQGCEPSDVLDFSASINPLGLSPMAKTAIMENLSDIVHYPDPVCSNLREILAKRHCLKPAQLLIGNGSTELIHLIPRALNLKKILITAPSFSEYENAAKLAGSEIDWMPLSKDHVFRVDVRVLVDRINDNQNNGIDAVFLCNPNNPTGHLLSKDEIISILKAAFHLGVLVILDEAFIDFTDAPSFMDEVSWYINLIVVRSFTKFYAMPGLRLGYLAANASVVSQIAHIMPPWSVNHFAPLAVIAALNDVDYRKKSHALVKAERRYLSEALSKLPGLRIHPTSANYLLLELSDRQLNAFVLAERLEAFHVLIRNCASFRGLNERYFRIAVKLPHENQRLVFLLQEILTAE